MVFFYHVITLSLLLYHIVFTKSEISPFGYCIQQKPSQGLLKCAGRQALHSLAHLEEMDNFTLTDGLMFIRDETQMSRSFPNFIDQDPMDFRGILENAGAVISQRTMQWDLSRVYPGLSMQIGPSHGTTGLLEFIMAPGSDNDRTYDEPPSTARILTKSFILPLLLGLKFNLLTLLPLIIGAIIFIMKKAAFLGKLALFISTAFGIGNIFSLGGIGAGGFGGGGGGFGGFGYGHHQPPYRPGFGGHGGFNDHLSTGYYKTENDVPTEKPPAHDHFYDYEKKVLLRDRASKVIEREVGGDDYGQASSDRTENQTGYRSFAWKTV